MTDPRKQPPDLAAAVRAIARDLETVRAAGEAATSSAAAAQATGDEAKGLAESAHQALAQVTRTLTKVAKDVNALASVVAGAGDEDEDRGELSWLTVPDEQTAGVAITNLVEWIAQVYGWYPDGVLGACWAWHPAAVSELLGCRAAWIDAYEGPNASSARVMDWLDRYRPGVAKRVAGELKGCSLENHAPNGPLEYRPPRCPGADQVGLIATWWADSHGTTAAPSPDKGAIEEERIRKDAKHTSKY